MTRVSRWLRPALLALLVLILPVAPLPSPTLAQGQPPDGWVSLGPDMPIEMYGLGVSSAWPDDPFIVARTRYTYERGTERRIDPTVPMVRTTDGGRTWEPLADAPAADRLTVIRTEKLGRVVLALPNRGSSAPTERDRPRYVSRSADDGTTWTRVHELASSEPPTLVVSPTAADDGYVYLLDGRALFETSDLGQTWVQRTPVDGQFVQSIVFSPQFARDRTLFAAVSTAGFRPQGEDDQVTAPAESAGVMVSRDAGLSWASVSAGLQVDGAPYRHVQALAISPAFVDDRTLFAFAWGPMEAFQGGGAKWKHTALFRSQDAGTSWQVVWQPEYRPKPLPGGLLPFFSLIMQPFPTFGDDGRIAVAVQSGSGTPSSGSCALMLSEDRGESWRSLDSPSSLTTCVTIIPTLRPAPTLIAGGIRSRQWNEAFVVAEQGASILRAPVASGFSSVNAGAEGPVVGADGSVFFGTNSGVWMLPPTAPLPPLTPGFQN